MKKSFIETSIKMIDRHPRGFGFISNKHNLKRLKAVANNKRCEIAAERYFR